MLNNSIQQAVTLLKKGELVIFPTDTVYGLGADANNEQAILRVFAFKNRPQSFPLIIHLPSLEHVSLWAEAAALDEKFFKLAKKFWPGALTIVVKSPPRVSKLITAGQDTIGLRIPNHPVALELLRAFNSGIVGTSANISGEKSLSSGEQAIQQFNNKIFILNGGECYHGTESTIISLVNSPTILRKGSIKEEQIWQVISDP